MAALQMLLLAFLFMVSAFINLHATSNPLFNFTNVMHLAHAFVALWRLFH
jgi:hypothetical protein